MLFRSRDTAIVANIARYHRGALPQQAHLPYVALDAADRLVVTKLAALLRVANALDAEHLQKVHSVRLIDENRTWTLQLEGSGDLTMEQMAAATRSDLFLEVFGPLAIKNTGIRS